MTPAAKMIAIVRSLGASISSVGSRLIIDAPQGVITQELCDEIGRLKPAILTELGAGRTFARAARTEAVHQVANLLAIAYRRHQAASLRVNEPRASGDSRLANSSNQSVHGGDS